MTDILTAWATLALAILAFVTAILAGLAFWKQRQETRDQAAMLKIQSEQLAEDRKVNAEQIRVLALQAEELKNVGGDREREAEERCKAQAVQVYVWQKVMQGAAQARGLTSGKTLKATLVNSSMQPVYNVTMQWMINGVLRDLTVREEPLKPEEEHSATVVVDSAVDPMAMAFFRDRAGVYWRTHADGRLEDATENTGKAPAPGAG